MECLKKPEDLKLSQLGESVDILLKDYKNYLNISKNCQISAKRLGEYHRIFKLPKGIMWLVDTGVLLSGHAIQIGRLEGEDQWLLAFVIMDEKLSVSITQKVVSEFVNKSCTFKDALSSVAGIDSERIKALLLPLSFDERFRISCAAWKNEMDWRDFCLYAINEYTRVDSKQIAAKLRDLLCIFAPEIS
jgi:hypothetical protein